MLTGTPLDLTPFGGLLSAVGLLYWGAALLLAALALWRFKRWWLKLSVAAIVLAVFVVPVAQRAMKVRAEQDIAMAKLAAATRLFEQRCQSAGERITRTVDKVEGVVWLKWRDTNGNLDDQFKLDDPYGHDCGGEDCIDQLLRLEGTAGRFTDETRRRGGRYRFVESVDPSDGKQYRYTGAMRPTWSDASIKKYREDTGKDIPDSSYRPKPARQPVDRFSARYGITWDDISTREDRENWIAGGSIKVIDLQTNEVIAERVGYMMDRGLGNRAGARSPWPMARRNACPAFRGGERSWPNTETLTFVTKVLVPAKSE